MRDGVLEEELLELAKKVNFTVQNDEDLIKLFRAARDVGFWPEMDRPRPNKKGFVPRSGMKQRFFLDNPSPMPLRNSWYWDGEPQKTRKSKKRDNLITQLDEINHKIAKFSTDLEDWLKNL